MLILNPDAAHSLIAEIQAARDNIDDGSLDCSSTRSAARPRGTHHRALARTRNSGQRFGKRVRKQGESVIYGAGQCPFDDASFAVRRPSSLSTSPTPPNTDGLPAATPTTRRRRHPNPD